MNPELELDRLEMDPGTAIQLLMGISLIICAAFFTLDLKRGRSKKIYTNATSYILLIAILVMAVGGILLVVKSFVIF